MSNRQIVEPESSGKLKISPRRFLAKTVLPAPIKVILGISYLLVPYYMILALQDIDKVSFRCYYGSAPIEMGNILPEICCFLPLLRVASGSICERSHKVVLEIPVHVHHA